MARGNNNRRFRQYNRITFNANLESPGRSTPVDPRVFVTRQLLPDDPAGFPEQKDGLTLISAWGYLWAFFGWDGVAGTKGVWRSADNGFTWVAQPDAPVASAEQYAVLRSDNKIWFFDVGDNRDVYTLDEFGTWEQKNSVPLTSVYGPLRVSVGDDFYLFGGQLSVGGSPINNTTSYKYNFSTNVLDNIGADTPSDFWSCTGTPWYKNGHIYAAGGAKCNNFSGTYEFLNDKIIRWNLSSSSWENVGTLPEEQRGIFVKSIVWDDKAWWINGFANGANQVGIYNSSNNVSWTLYSNNIPARHASSDCIHLDWLYIGFGNEHNDLYRIEKTTLPAIAFYNDYIRDWWYDQLPDERVTDAELEDINLYVQELGAEFDKHDFFFVSAGLSFLSAGLVPIKTTKTTFPKNIYSTGTPGWSTLEGLYGAGGGTSYWRAKWNASNHGVNFQQDDACVWAYFLRTAASSFAELTDGVKTYLWPYANDAGGTFYASVNSAADFGIATPGGNGKGFRGVKRTNNSQAYGIVETIKTLETSASGSVSGNDLFLALMGENSTGIAGWGSGSIDTDIVRTATRNYLTRRGITP